MNKIKHLILIFALVAFGQTAWAQQTINVNNESNLRSSMTINDVEYEHLFTDDCGAYYKFYYISTDAAGNPVRLSSLLAFQKPSNMSSSDVNNSVLINSHYTITADNQCPSNIHYDFLNLDFPDYTLLNVLFTGSNYYNYNELVSKSVIIMPDYEGYGVSADRTHLYLAEELTAKQVVDGAVCGLQLYQQLVSGGNAPRLASDWRSFSMGFSQGGAVALAVQRYIEQHGLSSDLRFRGTLCGDGPYDLIATLRYYMEDNGTSYDVTTDHRAEQATLPVVLPMILKGMIDSEPAMANYQLTDYLVEDFLATGILDWLNSKTVTNKQIAAAWLQQLENGSTTVNDITYPAPATMSQMFTRHGDDPWVDLSQVFTPGFYNYLTDLSNFNSVPSNPSNAYQAMHLALANNNLCTGWRPIHRIQFMHSKKDMVVPYGNYLAFRDAHPEGENIIYRVDNTFSTDDHLAAGTTFLSSLGQMGEKLHWIEESTLEWSGSGTEADPYQIWNGDDWQLLADRVNNGGQNYAGKYFKLMADINIEETFSDRPSKQVGHGENVNFRGTFDGNGHTMTVNFVDNNDEDYSAPFRYIRNATIKNLHVAGSITKTDNRNAGGLVGVAFGTCHISNCRSSVDIFFDDAGDCSSGGFIGELGESSDPDDTYFDNCLFDGTLRGSTANSWGGFIGWVKDDPDAYFTNCLFHPAQVNIDADDSKTFARGSGIHVGNCYYKQLINDAQGATNASSMSNTNLRAALGDGWEIVTEDGVEKVVPVMELRDLNGEGTEASPYLIATAEDWEALSVNVVLGETYSGKYFQLTDDISVTNMVGTNKADGGYNAFQGTFDGDGHTLTFTANMSEELCAPFRYVMNATIQNLRTTGAITTNDNKMAGGIAGRTYGTTVITNCISSMEINSSRNGDGTHGGLVANVTSGTLNLTGCVFNGSLLGSSTTHCGGLVGWTNASASVNITNCLFTPVSVTMSVDNSSTLVRFGNNNGNVTNSFYTQTFGTAQGQGQQVYKIKPANNINMQLFGIATPYNVSGLTIYGNSGHGFTWDDEFFAASGDILNLGLSVKPGYTATAYYANGNQLSEAGYYENSYKLNMPAENVIITAATTVDDWEGDGLSWETAYLIYNAGQLDLLSTRVNSDNSSDYNGKYYKVMADIEYDAILENNFTAIGTTIQNQFNHSFNGHFDGQGHTISGINSISSWVYYNGLFGELESGAEVKNVVLANCNIGDGERAGGIAGWNKGTVTDCHVNSDVTVKGTSAISAQHGGIVGDNEGTVSRCVFEGTLTKTFSNPDPESIINVYAYGGIVGINNTNATLSDNFVAGAVIPATMHGYGAVVGLNNGTLNRNYYIACTVNGVANATGVGYATVSGRDIVFGDATDNDGAVPGNVRYVEGYGDNTQDFSKWVFIASPVSGSIEPTAVDNIFPAAGASSTDYDLYRFDQTGGDNGKEWKNYHTNSFNLVNGQGYLYANKNDVTLTFNGTNFNTGIEPVEMPLSYVDGPELAGWNLVGNPFPRAAYVDRSYYLINAEGTAVEPQAVSQGTVIRPCTGVMVKAENTGEVVAFSTMPSSTDGAINNGNLEITVAQANTTRGSATLDKAIVSFNEGDQLGKFYFGEQNANIYLPQGGKEYAIVSVGRDVARYVSTEIPVNFKANENGQYTITVNPEGVEMTYLHLIDNMTGADVDLLATKVPEPIEGPGVSTSSTTSYTFNAKTTDYESRFKLVFVANGEVGPSTGSGTFAFINAAGNIIVDGEGTLQVIDILGRQISSQEIHSAFLIQHSTFAPGVYVLRLINGDDVRTQKIVIE